MKDKHGKEIQVGDTICHASGDIGVIHEVASDYYKCMWGDGMQCDVKFRNSTMIEIVTTIPEDAEVQSPMSLSELKRQAQQEILELIQKHTALINSAGGNFGVNVSLYDTQGIISKHPKQLVDVNVTVTI